MDDFYLPAAPPAHLTDFALRALSQKRVVGAGLPRHTGIRGAFATGARGSAGAGAHLCMCKQALHPGFREQ